MNSIDGSHADVIPYVKSRKNSPPDISGVKYERLSVIGYCGAGAGYKQLWLCSCDCGSIIVVFRDKIESGHTKSCGCLQRDMTYLALKKHGLSSHYLYELWTNIKKRCLNAKTPNYHRYGGRGISISSDWVDDFPRFAEYILDNLGERPDGMSLDRIDNNGNYEEGNIRWATAKQQANNRSSGYKDKSQYFGEDYK